VLTSTLILYPSKYDWFFQMVSSILFFGLHSLFIHLSVLVCYVSSPYISRIWQILQITKFLIFKYFALRPVAAEAVVNSNNYINRPNNDNSVQLMSLLFNALSQTRCRQKEECKKYKLTNNTKQDTH
jgi:hypothetical protein